MPLSVRNFIITFSVSAIIFSVFAFLLTGFVVDSIGPVINGGAITTAVDSGNQTDDEGKPVDQTPSDIKGNSFNILLIGTDYQPNILNDYNPKISELYPMFGRINGPADTEHGFPPYAYRKVSPDTIILARVSKEKNQFTFTALPTNMHVSTGGSMTTLGDLYQDEGLDYFISKINAITGLPINYYAIIDIEGLAKAIDIVDGITYTVPADMTYSDPSQNLTISLRAGSQKLNGNQALQMLRYSKYTSGANNRLKTGISFIRALASKMTNIIYITKVPGIFEQVSPYITTNFTAKDLTNNLDLIFAYPKFESFELTYPGSYSEKDGKTYFEPNISQAITNFSSYR